MGAYPGMNVWQRHAAQQGARDDEQRHAKLAEFSNLYETNRITPAQLSQAVDDIYKDAAPEHRMSIVGRILHHKKAKQQDTQNAEGKQKRATEEASIISGAKQPGQAEADADTVKKQSAMNAIDVLWPNAPPEQKDALRARILGGAGAQAPFKEFSSPDGKQHNWFRVGEQPEGWNATQGEAKPGKGRPAWKKNPNGSFSSVLLDPATNQPIPGSENNDVQPPASLSGRITTGFYHFVDDKGEVHQVQETHTSMPAGASSGQPAAGGKGPAPKAGAPRGDKVLGRKDTATTTAAKKDYVQAVKLASLAQQVKLNPNDAINQKRLAVALERISAGRFTVEALDYIKKAGWGNTIDEWALKPTTGGLPPDVMRQLIDGANQNLKAAKDAMDEAENLGGSSDQPAPGKPKKGDTKNNSSGDAIIFDGTKWGLKSAAAAAN